MKAGEALDSRQAGGEVGEATTKRRGGGEKKKKKKWQPGEVEEAVLGEKDGRLGIFLFFII